MRKRDLNIRCVVSSIQAQAAGSREQTLNGKGRQGGCLRGGSLSWRVGLLLSSRGKVLEKCKVGSAGVIPEMALCTCDSLLGALFVGC